MIHTALALSLALQGNIHVVDDDAGPGVGFADLQPAIDAAADGDLILVRSGSYSNFSLVDRELAIVADTGAQVDVIGTPPENPAQPLITGPLVAVVDTPLGGSTTLIGLDLHASIGPGLQLQPDENGLLANDPSTGGLAWVERVEAFGNELGGFPQFAHEASGALASSSRALLVDVWAGPSAPLVGTTGMDLFGTTYAYGCEAQGAQVNSIFGFEGARVLSSGVLAVGCRFLAATSSNGFVIGTHGLRVDSADTALGPFASPGPGSVVSLDCEFSGEIGDVALGVDSQFVESAAQLPARRFDKPNVVRSGQPAQYTLSGTPGEFAVLLLSTALADEYVLEYKGYLAPAAPVLVPVGVIPPSGQITVDFSVQLTPGTSFVRLYEQAAFVSLTDGIVLSNPRQVFLLGPGL